jgi:peptide/nickel transport system substrate-binding protein
MLRRQVSRRDFLRTAAGGSATLAAGLALAACTSSSPKATQSVASPKRGGTLQAGLVGGSSSDTLDALNPLNEIDIARGFNLYEPLVVMSSAGQPVNLLAEEVTPNSTATQWTIRVHKGITFHNGKELDAQDVIFTLQSIVDPKKPTAQATFYAPMDTKNLKVVDKYTVQVPCLTPWSNFPEVLSAPAYGNVIPLGYDVKNPVGTGPFSTKSFTPGVSSTFTRNPNYWQSGLPYVDSLVITDYADEQAQINALLAGQADVIDDLSAASMNTVTGSGKQILLSLSSGYNPIVMRTDVAPFNDVRVRQAMRLIVDRQQMMNVVFAGHGIIGNDVFGYATPEYDHSIPQRQQDIGQAKSLLKAAGQDGMNVELVVADLAQGLTSSAEVFAQQAKAADVTVKLRKITVTDWFNNFLKWPFTLDYWYYYYYLPAVAFTTLSTANFSDTHFSNPRYDSLYKEALATLDAGKRHEIEHEMMMIDYEEGGNIIPFFYPVIDAYAKNVNGLKPAKTGLSLNNFNFKSVWMS